MGEVVHINPPTPAPPVKPVRRDDQKSREEKPNRLPVNPDDLEDDIPHIDEYV
ncbi:hypothetical protein QP938_08925 [Porticoccaceae bacterium LTM1]|nr:hypothetical protein QP938_08925 [Porticoccaceae bacterium LTM1]